MTVQEAKKEMEICNELMLYDFSYGEEIPYESLNESNKKLYDAHVIAIGCMEEVEQYRALGTVEEIKKKLQTELPYMSLAQARFKSELDEYRNLGTVEELKEAREKQVAKKPKDIDEECGTFVCPSCESMICSLDDMTVHQHCLICGQKLDWEEGGTSD